MQISTAKTTEVTATHLLYDGQGGWIEAKKVWVAMPEAVDGAESEWGWEFKNADDAVRWLRA